MSIYRDCIFLISPSASTDSKHWKIVLKQIFMADLRHFHCIIRIAVLVHWLKTLKDCSETDLYGGIKNTFTFIGCHYLLRLLLAVLYDIHNVCINGKLKLSHFRGIIFITRENIFPYRECSNSDRNMIERVGLANVGGWLAYVSVGFYSLACTCIYPLPCDRELSSVEFVYLCQIPW